MTTSQHEVLRPSPLDLGGVIQGALGTFFKRRFGQFALLALIPSIVLFVLLIAAIVPLLIGIFASINNGNFNGLVVVGIVAIFVAFFIGYLAQIKIQAMITLGSHDVIHQHPSTTRQLSQRTAGVIGRVLLLVLLVLAAIFVVYGLIVGIFLTIVFGSIAASGANDPGAAVGPILAGSLILIILAIAASVFAFYLTVRFLYFMPGLAIERLGALDSLKRSWRLTEGNFWRTLGYYLIGSLLVWLASYLVSLLGQLFSIPAMSTSATVDNDPTAAALVLIPALVVIGLLSFAVQILALPFMTSYVTVMYVDQLRRNELPPGYRRGIYPPGAPMSHPQGPPPSGPGAYPQTQWDQQPPQEQPTSTQASASQQTWTDQSGVDQPSAAPPLDGEPVEDRPRDVRPGDARPGNVRPGHARPGDARPGDARPGEEHPEPPEGGRA